MVKYLKGSKESKTMLLEPSHSFLIIAVLRQNFHNLCYVIVFIIFLVYMVVSYIELWVMRHNHKSAMRNLSLTLLGTTIFAKVATYVVCRKCWLDLIEHVTELERLQLQQNDAITKKIITEYSYQINRGIFRYNKLIITTLLSKITAPLIKYFFSANYKEEMKNGDILYPELLSCWVPFDKTSVIGYWIVTLVQLMICFISAGIIKIFDCNYIVLMSFFAGQLKLLSVKCEQLFGNGKQPVTFNEALHQIRACHYHHLYIVKYVAAFNSLISPVMFLHVIMFSLMIGAKCIELTMDVARNKWQIWALENLFSIIAQLFLYCWYSNEVLVASNRVDTGVYSSAWWSQNVRMRRNVLLLSRQLHMPIEFTAGPFNKLNLGIFITIIKTSYSYYALFSQLN